MSIIAKRRGGNTPTSGKPILTAAMFLGKGKAPAYVTPKQILEFVDNGRIEDVEETDAGVGMVKERLKIVVPRKLRTDKGNVPYKYYTFIRPNGPDGAKVVMIGNIDQFFKDYRDGKFITDFTLEDLISEAEKV